MVDVSRFVNVKIDLSKPSARSPDFKRACIYSSLLKLENGFTKAYSDPDELLQDENLKELQGDKLTRLTSSSPAYIAASHLTSKGINDFVIGACNPQNRGTRQKIRIKTTADKLAPGMSLTLKPDGDDPITVSFGKIELAATEADTAELVEASEETKKKATKKTTKKLNADIPSSDQALNNILDAIMQNDKLRGLININDHYDEAGNLDYIDIEPFIFSHKFELSGLKNDFFEVSEEVPQEIGDNVYDDLTRIHNDINFYALIGLEQDTSSIIDRARWTENNKKVHICTASDREIKSESMGLNHDIANVLRIRAFTRTVLLYSSQSRQYPDARWFGEKLPGRSGAVSYAYADLSPITHDNLSEGDFNRILSKNANAYVESAGRKFAFNGKSSAGNFIDEVIGVDWIKSQIETNIFSFLSSQQEKIDFTDDGIAMISQKLEESLSAGIKQKVLQNYEIKLPAASSFTAEEIQSRNLTGILWTGQLSGGIHTVKISGTVVHQALEG